jgi:hypothetical protein
VSTDSEGATKMPEGWNRIVISPYGCAVHLPCDWETLPPVPSNGQEILRATGGAGRGVIVFKMRTSAPSTAEIAHKVIDRLSGLGYVDFTCQEPTFAEQQATRLESPRAAVG